MRPSTLGRMLLGLLLAGLLLAATAEAARKPITGRLSASGYTVLAVSDSGRIASGRATPAFRLVPPAATVELQLRDAQGVYAGMVVVGGTAKRAIVGVRAGARLGRLALKAGHARARKLPRRFVNARRFARARGGVPLGAGNFGFVRVPGARAAQAGEGPDSDLDGVPDGFDVAPGGGLLMASVDPTAPASAFGLFSLMHLPLTETVNANALATTAEAIDETVARKLVLRMRILGADARLDCGGLPYCSPGGTGKQTNGPQGSAPADAGFPACCSPDDSGSGLMTPSTFSPTEFFLGPATPAVGTGDTFIQRYRDAGGADQAVSETLGFAFRTAPAVRSLSSGGAVTTIAYPVAPGAPGTGGNGFVVPGDQPVELTVWRPQRDALPGEPPGLVDIGRLRWRVYVLSVGASSYSAALPERGACPGLVVDPASDAPADPAETFSFTFDLPACLAAQGRTWKAGDRMELQVHASTLRTDNAAQLLTFRHG